jgi:hypothetical protein
MDPLEQQPHRAEDLLVQGPQVGGRLDAQFLGQVGAQPGVPVQRLAPAGRPRAAPASAHRPAVPGRGTRWSGRAARRAPGRRSRAAGGRRPTGRRRRRTAAAKPRGSARPRRPVRRRAEYPATGRAPTGAAPGAAGRYRPRPHHQGPEPVHIDRLRLDIQRVPADRRTTGGPPAPANACLIRVTRTCSERRADAGGSVTRPAPPRCSSCTAGPRPPPARRARCAAAAVPSPPGRPASTPPPGPAPESPRHQ